MKNMEHFHEMKSLTRKQKFCLLSLIPAYFIVIGLVVQPLQEIVPGIVNIIREPDFLITDYFVAQGCSIYQGLSLNQKYLLKEVRR